MIRAILACDLEYGIGYQNKLPWGNLYPEDLSYFKEQTSGGTVVMGGSTLRSLPFKNGLPNRENIVLTRGVPDLDKLGYRKPSENMWHFNEKYLDHYIKTRYTIYNSQEADIWLIGGKSIYEKYAKYVQQWHITKINDTFEVDTQIDLTGLDEKYSLTKGFTLCEDSDTRKGAVVEVWTLNK